MVRLEQNGRVRVQFKYVDPRCRGERRTFNRLFDVSLAEARAIEPELRRAAREGKLDRLLGVAVSAPTSARAFSTVARQYVAVHAAASGKIGGGFKRDAEVVVENHLIPFFADRPINAITKFDLERFRAAKRAEVSPRGKPYSLKTIYNLETVLRGVLRWAWECGHTRIDAGLLLPAIPKKRRENPEFKNFYTPGEMALALDAVAAHEARVRRKEEPRRFDLEWHLVLWFMFESGVRIGELSALTRFDVNTRARTVRVNKNIYLAVVQTTKGGDDRQLPLSPDICTAMDDHVRSLDPDNPILFPNSRGGHLSSNSLDKVLAWIADTVVVDEGPPVRKLHRITPHGFRHSCGTALAAADVGAEKIRLHLGHNDLQMVQRYVHLATKPDHEINRRLVDLLRRARQGTEEPGDVVVDMQKVSATRPHP
ncbi:MAG: site-specific integrase [Deltaproteobacteria bacterium]|nr:site-specific integrase [Deltaproteobacteria bacterium]